VAENAAVACVATNRDVAVSPPSPFKDCQDVVHLSLFFDGTGNNREMDTDSRSWSNIGRMFDAALQDDAKSTYAIYIAGVSTRYSGKATCWLDSTGIWVEDKFGGLSGSGGDRRLRQGDDSVNDRLKEVLIANAQAAGRELATDAASATEKGFAKVNDALSQHRLIKIITMSFVGFSRGAALPRVLQSRDQPEREKRYGPVFSPSRLTSAVLSRDDVARFGQVL